MRTPAKFVFTVLAIVAFLLFANVPGSAFANVETIHAVAWGTNSQQGDAIGVELIIYEFSTADDRGILFKAYQKGMNQGLVNALSKMKAVGHLNVQGTMGYDVSYIRMTPTPTGRKIRFITNRKITFGEDFSDSQSQSFNLTAGEIDINEKDQSKSAGLIYPAAQLVIDSQGQLQWDLNQNAWKLNTIHDWNGTPGTN
ncbi:MAG TPA: hypothetical protein VMU28_01930 [Terriglobales bacterium]|nr:hypothetical protein [Terriglobales bacterium]